MKVSIIIPVYGVAQWIERCAESLMRQTYADIEYIFVDDCTTDDSVEIIRQVALRFPDRTDTVRILRHETNRGVAAARNTGTKAATGDAVMHVDGDDYVRDDMVVRMVEEMERSVADVVECGYVKVDEGGETLVPPVVCGDETYLRLLLCQNLVHNGMWCRLISRNLFTERNIEFMEGVNYGDDFAVIPRVMVHSKKRSVVNECLYYYNCVNLSSYTHKVDDRHSAQYIQAMNAVSDYIEKCDSGNRYASALDVGKVNVLRHIRRYAQDSDALRAKVKFRPTTTIGRMMGTLMNGKIPLAAANVIYLLWRKLLVLKWTMLS